MSEKDELKEPDNEISQMDIISASRRSLISSLALGSASLILSSQAQGSHTNLRQLSYGDRQESMVDSDDPTAYGSYHYEPITFSGEEGDQIQIEMSSDAFSAAIWLYSPRGERLERANSPASISTTLLADGDYTIRAWATPEGETGSYTISLSEQGAESSGAGGTDIRSITYGETKESVVDDGDPVDFGSFYYEPLTFSGEEGDQIQIEMSSDAFTPVVWLYSPRGEQLERANTPASISTMLPADGDYTIRAWGAPEGRTGPYTISLSENNQQEREKDYHRLRVMNPLSKRGVGGVDVRIYRVSVTPGIYGSASPDEVELVSRTTTTGDGVAVFDGDTGGTALPQSQLRQFRSEYATENNAGIVVTCVDNQSSEIRKGTWFIASQFSADEFFSQDTVGTSLVFDSQLLLPPTSENGVSGTVSIWREVGTSGRSQVLNAEVSRAAAMTANPNGTFETVGQGTLSMKVPESTSVAYEGTSTSISSDFRQGSNRVSDDSHRWDIASFAADQTTPSLPSHAMFGSEYFEIEEGMDSDDKQAQIALDAMGMLPYIGTATDVYSWWETYFRGESEVVETLSNESDQQVEISRNSHDTVTSKSWGDRPFSVTFSVPVVLPENGGNDTFGFHGFWSRGTLNGRNTFDYQFSLGTEFEI